MLLLLEGHDTGYVPPASTSGYGGWQSSIVFTVVSVLLLVVSHG